MSIQTGNELLRQWNRVKFGPLTTVCGLALAVSAAFVVDGREREAQPRATVPQATARAAFNPAPVRGTGAVVTYHLVSTEEQAQRMRQSDSEASRLTGDLVVNRSEYLAVRTPAEFTETLNWLYYVGAYGGEAFQVVDLREP